jgi:hypothetical protein
VHLSVISCINEEMQTAHKRKINKERKGKLLKMGRRKTKIESLKIILFKI